MKIEVTQAHIDAGKRGRYTKCPVALAVKDALGVKLVKVGSDIHIGRPHMAIIHRTPDEVASFIDAFDHNQSHGVTPFSFDLDFPQVAA